MAARVGSGLCPLKVHGEVAKRDVSHLHDETSCLREPRLLECHFASEGGLNREAFKALYLFQNEGFEFPVYNSPYLIRDSDIRTAVEFRGSIVCVKAGDSKTLIT
jgi:hypothetical protein